MWVGGGRGGFLQIMFKVGVRLECGYIQSFSTEEEKKLLALTFRYVAQFGSSVDYFKTESFGFLTYKL